MTIVYLMKWIQNSSSFICDFVSSTNGEAVIKQQWISELFKEVICQIF